MRDAYGADPLRDRLIVAGIEDIATHGLPHFSLRRVAAACQTSCAAPYRHFDSKETFLREIVRYINRQWELLRAEILHRWKDDPRRCLIEISLAYIRFSVANPQFRRILSEAGEAASSFAEKAMQNFCTASGRSGAAAKNLRYRLSALVYGTVSMLEDGALPNEEPTWQMIRISLEALMQEESGRTAML